MMAIVWNKYQNVFNQALWSILYNPSTLVAEAGGWLRIWGQDGLQNDFYAPIWATWCWVIQWWFTYYGWHSEILSQKINKKRKKKQVSHTFAVSSSIWGCYQIYFMLLFKMGQKAAQLLPCPISSHCTCNTHYPWSAETNCRYSQCSFTYFLGCSYKVALLVWASL